MEGRIEEEKNGVSKICFIFQTNLNESTFEYRNFPRFNFCVFTCLIAILKKAHKVKQTP